MQILLDKSACLSFSSDRHKQSSWALLRILYFWSLNLCMTQIWDSALFWGENEIFPSSRVRYLPPDWIVYSFLSSLLICHTVPLFPDAGSRLTISMESILSNTIPSSYSCSQAPILYSPSAKTKSWFRPYSLLQLLNKTITRIKIEI